MDSQTEPSVCYQNRLPDQRGQSDLVVHVQLENPTNLEIEEGFRNLNSKLPNRIKNASFILQEKYGNKAFIFRNWLNFLLLLASAVLLILMCCVISNSISDNEKQIVGVSLKCNICGPGVKFHTMLGDVYGNVCAENSTEQVSYECGPESACFTMNVTQSQEMRQYLVKLKERLKNESHPYSNAPLLHNGMVKGCLNGFIWDERCHYFNTSMFFPNQTTPYWTATNTCTCTKDNCN